MKKGRQRQFLQEQKKDNRGSSLVTVMAVLALVSILVVTILSLTAVNYRMKLIDMQAKSNFYSAETALDEIQMGLQQEVAEAFSESYLSTMQSYESTDKSQRETIFREKFQKVLKEKLKSAINASEYNVDSLNRYLDKTKWDNVKKTGARLSSTKNALNIEERGIVLKNLVAEYTDYRGGVSQIKTDIVLEYPDMEFIQTSNMPEVLDYALVANKKFTAPGGHVEVIGNAYLGREGADFITASVFFGNLPGKVDKGILVTDCAWNITQGSQIQVRDMELWGRDIAIDGSGVDIDGKMYIKNDLLISNTVGTGSGKPLVNVKLSGEYYGYGNPKTAAEAASMSDQIEEVEKNPAEYSSSIIVNGIKANIDITGLNHLMLSGNAYIGASGKSIENVMKNKDILMGESLAVKSSQTAYLVPGECIAPGTENGGRNPMTAAQYQALLEETGGEAGLVDLTETVSEKLGATLSELGVSGYQTVCYPVNRIGSMVYLFMNFNDDQAAAKFWETYHQNNQNLQKLQEELNLYTKSIQLPADISARPGFYYNGNVVVNDGGENSFYTGKIAEISEAEKKKLEKSQKKYQDSFTALGKKLKKDFDILTDVEKSPGRELYDNLVGSFYSSDPKKNIRGQKIFISNGEHPLGAILIDGDYVIDEQTVDGVNQAGEHKNARLRVVISSGDVTIKKDFEGLVLAKGSIRIESAEIKITASPSDVAVTLLAENQDGIRPFDYLIGMEEYMVGGLEAEAGSDTSNDISKLVIYENWMKQ